jgi:hypothetical protein
MSQRKTKLGIAKPKLAYCEPWVAVISWSQPERRRLQLEVFRPDVLRCAMLLSDLNAEVFRAAYMVIQQLHELQMKPTHTE